MNESLYAFLLSANEKFVWWRRRQTNIFIFELIYQEKPKYTLNFTLNKEKRKQYCFLFSVEPFRK